MVYNNEIRGRASLMHHLIAPFRSFIYAEPLTRRGGSFIYAEPLTRRGGGQLREQLFAMTNVKVNRSNK